MATGPPPAAAPAPAGPSWLKPWTWFGRGGGGGSDDGGLVGHCCGCSCSGGHPVEGGSYLQRCRFGATEAGLPLSRFPTASFDTVVDAFGLCSHDDPVQVRLPALCTPSPFLPFLPNAMPPNLRAQVLREAARVCKPGGKILLLEHGRGHYDWLNSRLDSSAAGHHQKWGCWWNRDIEEIIEKVSEPSSGGWGGSGGLSS